MNGYPNASEMRKMFEEKMQEQKALMQMGLPGEQGMAPPNINTQLIPDDYVQSPVEETLTSTPMAEQAELDPFLAQNMAEV